MKKVFVYDPTAKDELSKVRGVGRYLQILKENFSNEFNFIYDLRSMIDDSIFINPFFNFLQQPLILNKIAKKQIAVIHDLIPLKYPEHFPAGIRGNINIYLNRRALENYDVIITDSQASKKDIVNMLGVKESRVKVVYPCLPRSFNLEFKIQSSKFNSEFRIINSKTNSEFSILNSKFCLYVGDATWNKNLVNLAKAIKIADSPCVFVGKVFNSSNNLDNYWQKELREFLNETKGDKRFIFPGFISDNELIKLYQQARVNILVSRDEGFGFSYVEAAYNKCPSVLADIPVLREISDGKALFAKPEEPENVAKSIIKLYSNNELKTKLGFEAQQQVAKYSGSSFKQSFLNVLDGR